MAFFKVGFVIFEEMTQLDFTGPLQAWRGCPNRQHILSPNPRLPWEATVG